VIHHSILLYFLHTCLVIPLHLQVFCNAGSLSHEAKEVFLAALVSEGRAEWMDKGHKKCLILWLRIQDWANLILNFVKDNGLEVMTVEEIRSGIDTRGTELEGINRGAHAGSAAIGTERQSSYLQRHFGR